jgi:4-aminobutyrate aminotransferase-like enzyme
MSNKKLLERRSRLLGASAPLFYDEPVHIVRGEGVWLYDADGQQYLDVYNNVPHVGHCHPHVVEALTMQASTLNVHSRYLHEAILEYAERLTATFDESLSMAIFTCTGTEANEVALRMARQHTGRMGIICSNFTYHGNSTAVWELATVFHEEGKSPSPNVRTVPFPDSYRPVFDLEEDALWEAYADEVEKVIASLQSSDIGFAGLIFCPIFSGEGLPNVSPLYMQKMIEHVHNAGGLFISDEVQAGFGRTGNNMWGHQKYSVIPDIVTMGKPMGNGHPLAGVVARADLLNEFRDTSMYFNTFGGNPVSCEVGMAVLDVLEQEKLLENAVSVGDYVQQGLRSLQDKHGLIGDVRGSGLFFGLDLVIDRTTKQAATVEAKHVINEMRNKGILIAKIGQHDNVLKMRPPMPFSTENADQLLSTLDDVLKDI